MPHNSFKELEENKDFQQPPHIERAVESHLRSNLQFFRTTAQVSELYLTKVFSTFIAFVGGDAHRSTDDAPTTSARPPHAEKK